MNRSIDWAVSKADAQRIARIVRLATANHPSAFNPGTLTMDLTACHRNDCELDLLALEAAGSGDTQARFDFAHDLAGITRHIDRTTGQLGDCFLPRFARKQR